jgi:Transposase DDE domain group 1
MDHARPGIIADDSAIGHLAGLVEDAGKEPPGLLVRTASGPPRTPARATFPSTASPKTRSGASWWQWHASCWRGPRCSPCTAPARRWEPKWLRLRLFSAAGRIVSTGRRLQLRIATRWPWASHITAAIRQLQALTRPNNPSDPGRRTAGLWNPPARRYSRAATLTSHQKKAASASIKCKHSPRSRSVMRAVCDRVRAGPGGLHGLSVMALRRTAITFWPCLRAVSM